MIQCFQVMTFKLSFLCVISDFRSGVHEIFALMKRYAAYIGSVTDVSEKMYPSHRSGSSRTFRNLLVPLPWVKQDVSEIVEPFVIGEAGRFGTCRSHCHELSRTFRKLSVPLSWVKQDVSETVGPVVMGQA